MNNSFLRPRLSTAAWLIAILSCLPASATTESRLDVIPIPKSLQREQGSIELDSESPIYASDQSLLPLARTLSDSLATIARVKLSPTTEETGKLGITLRIDTTLPSEAYKIEVADSITISGGDYRGVAWAASTLVQLVDQRTSKLSFPKVTISDAPDNEFRSLMLDVARRPHPAHTLKETIKLMWLYKVNYLHLHLSDNQSFVFPSQNFPKLPTPNWAYSVEEMDEIIQFADDHGVTIIPEIDVPGHSGHWVRKMPAAFGTTDPVTGESRSIGIVNMANEQAYTALDSLIGELCEKFKSSPYIHIGGDEVGAGGLIKLPEYQPYCSKHGLSEAAEGRAHELYLHFLQRVSRMVAQHGKQTIVWNDFGGVSTPNAKVPDDVIAMAWTGSPLNLAKKGHRLVNCSPYPLYLVPPQQLAPEAYRMYAWNANEYMRWSDKNSTPLPSEAVLGAQLCFWEQRYNEVLPILIPRLPVFSERLWNRTSGLDFPSFRAVRNRVSDVAQRVVTPVQFEITGLANENGLAFEEAVKIKMTSATPGKLVYVLSKDWEHFPDEGSNVYTHPITIDDTTTVSARLYDDAGQPLGGVTQQRFQKITPAYKYRLLGPAPRRGWKSFPDFSKLEQLQEGITGLMTADRARQINRSMFAGLDPRGHVDVRVHDVYNPITLELKSQIKIPAEGSYTFSVRSRDGLCRLSIGGQKVIETASPGRSHQVVGTLKPGVYPVTLEYFHRVIFNDLNIQVKVPNSSKFEPYEALVLPISEWLAPDRLMYLPSEPVFVDPKKAENMNLATDRPVVVSGGTEGVMVPSNAVDGLTDNSSGWHASPYPQWLQVDLEKVHRINRVKLFTFHDESRHYQYTIQASRDGDTWSKIVDMAKNVRPAAKNGFEHNFTPVDARYIRVNMLVNSANPGIHINELMVFGRRSRGYEPLRATGTSQPE